MYVGLLGPPYNKGVFASLAYRDSSVFEDSPRTRLCDPSREERGTWSLTRALDPFGQDRVCPERIQIRT